MNKLKQSEYQQDEIIIFAYVQIINSRFSEF